MSITIGISGLFNSLFSFCNIFRLYVVPCKTESELFIFLLQSAILSSHFGIQNKAVNVYVSVYSQLNLRGTLYVTIIIHFYIKYNNVLSFELLKYSKFLSSRGLCPQSPAWITQYYFWKLLQKILPTSLCAMCYELLAMICYVQKYTHLDYNSLLCLGSCQ